MSSDLSPPNSFSPSAIASKQPHRMPSSGDSFEVMLRLKLPRGNFNLSIMNNLYWSSGVLHVPNCPGTLLRHTRWPPYMVSESTASNTKLSEFFCPDQGPGRELSEFLSACFSCAKASSMSFSPTVPQRHKYRVVALQNPVDPRRAPQSPAEPWKK